MSTHSYSGKATSDSLVAEDGSEMLRVHTPRVILRLGECFVTRGTLIDDLFKAKNLSEGDTESQLCERIPRDHAPE